MKINNPLTFKLIETSAELFTVASGAAGWVDTDISSAVPIGAKGCTGIAVAAVNCAQGVRAHGSVADPVMYNITALSFTSGVDTVSHVDLLRNAITAVEYRILGYFL